MKYKFRKRCHVITIFMVVVFIPNILYADFEEKLPSKCKSDCVSPYGKVTGVSKRGIKAYSNCNSKCVIYEPNKLNGTYTGIKWQCVEYARRWLLANRNAVYGDVDIASDIWGEINHLTDVSTNKKILLKSYLNGSYTPPKIGDLLIYAKAFNGTGHVAVIVDVDYKNNYIYIAEQNYSNKLWTKNYSRKINLINKDGKYWLLDSYLLGWKHITN